MTESKFDCRIIPCKDYGFFWITFFGEIGAGRLARAHEEFTGYLRERTTRHHCRSAMVINSELTRKSD